MNRLALIVAAVIILIGIIGISASKSMKSNPGPLSVTPTAFAPKAVTKKISEENPKQNYSIDISYPQIQGFDGKTQAAINQKITALLATDISDFKKSVSGNDTSRLPAELKTMKNTLTVTYDIAQLSRKIVSIKFTGSNYIAGAAHPANYVLTFNYSVSMKKELILSDVFKPQASYLQIISPLAASDLANQDKKMNQDFSTFIKDGTAPKAENFQFFLLTKDALVLAFPPYQVAPGVVGTQQVSIPFSKLSPYLNQTIL